MRIALKVILVVNLINVFVWSAAVAEERLVAARTPMGVDFVLTDDYVMPPLDDPAWACEGIEFCDQPGMDEQ